ncbi:MAG: hypothetical protein IJS54_06815 [Desulfovibrio sp.]|nr:hypothetical protein [Desulfovibrio sp.]
MSHGKLDVNGYTSQFKQFVDFANNEIQTNGKKGQTSIAQLDGTTTLGDSTIKVNTNDTVGKLGARTQDIKDANNVARNLFKKAIADMYGGEKNIPKSVLDAMKLSDFDKGRPLTARRILAVKTAIDSEGTAKLNTFKSADAPTVALQMGWTKAELPKIARAAHFLSAATGVDEFTAIEQLSTPGSKANRLMNYGGRFMDSASNFANGLRLMDSFADWFKGICDSMKPVYDMDAAERDFTPANTFTKLNFHTQYLDPKYEKGLEKFVFEELSVNPKANLAETDMEKVFGFKNNRAMAFFGQGYGFSYSSTIANIPKEKRAVIYAALNAFVEPANNANQAREKNMGLGSMTKIAPNDSPIVIARLLKNFDRAEAMFKAGKMTAENIIKAFFSEIPDKGDYNYKTIHNYFKDISRQLSLGVHEGGKYTDVSSRVLLAMEKTGLPFEETVQIVRDGSPQPTPNYLNTGSMDLQDFDGTTEGGRKRIENDLYRPDFCYRFTNNVNKPLLDAKKGGFGFTFPGEDKFYTNGLKEGRENIQRVGDKVIAMCGSVHVNQANSVMMMLSQAGLSNLCGGLGMVNCTSNEHAPVDYTISKNNETGDVTITYSSPEDLPFRFEWSSTIDVNGHVTSTPMTVEKKTLDQNVVAAALDKATARMKVNLTETQKAKAAQFLSELGQEYQLEGKKLDLFANFVVRLNLTAQESKSDAQYASDMAKTISNWTEFEVGKGEEAGVGQVETKIKNLFNELIEDAMADAAKGAQSKHFKEDSDISSIMLTDANRGIYIFNGKTLKGSKDEVISTFKKTITNPALRQGLSTILNQVSIMTFSSLSMRGPMAATQAHPQLNSATFVGIEKIVSRGNDQQYLAPTIRNSKEFFHNFTLGENGTATYTISAKHALMMGAGRDMISSYGSVSYQCVFQIDLNGDKPVITDVKLAQTFDAKEYNLGGA